MSTPKIRYYADIVLPLAIPKPYTYRIPFEYEGQILFGVRVEVPIRNKLMSGIVVHIHQDEPEGVAIKSIRSIVDETPTITVEQYRLWKWIAGYYCCSVGEVMSAALPGALKLYSETKIIRNANFSLDEASLSDDEYMIMEAVQMRKELNISEIQDILNKRSVYPLLHELIRKNALYIKEELIEKFKPKKQKFVGLGLDIDAEKVDFDAILESIGRSELQKQCFIGFVQLGGMKSPVLQKQLMQITGVGSSVIKALVKKSIFTELEREVSRLNPFDVEQIEDQLSPLQQEKFGLIKAQFNSNKMVLLHGVTGSGKTRIYIELIKEQLEKNKQVLFLLPEIALTTQMIGRIKYYFGDDLLVYHSKMNSNERVEVYRAVFNKGKVIVGPRSALFLPFNNLGLVIVDEEHDQSYKQHSPAPRFQGRDVAVVLANYFKANVLFGTATPSLETWTVAKNNRIELVQINERFGGAKMPDIELIDMKYMYRTGQVKDHFSKQMIDSIRDTVVRKRQVILFQNRRGHSPLLECPMCGWVCQCNFCDVSMTYHQFFDEMRCHYCGARKKIPVECPACATKHLDKSGIGTQKIEEHLKAIFPDMRIARLDLDSAKTKKQFEKILYDFENGQIDILIGTQMITKGLDFENVELVGVVNADRLFYTPDFRAMERAFQMLLQVSGRAGRRDFKGRVLVQTYDPTHYVFTDFLNQDFDHFFAFEYAERKKHLYPPYVRLIEVDVLHKKVEIARTVAQDLVKLLRPKFGKRISEAFEPSVSRIRGYYIRKIVIKIERDASKIAKMKEWIAYYRSYLLAQKGQKSTRININVDP